MTQNEQRDKNVTARGRTAPADLVRRPIEIDATSPRHLPSIRLSGITLHALTEEQCVTHILDELEDGAGGWVATHNLDHLRRLERDAAFRGLCDQADLRVADGMPLVWACALQGTPLPERVAGSSLVSSLTAGAADRGRSIFLLGGNPGAAEGAADELRERHESLTIAGTHCPPVGFEQDEDEMNLIIETLREAQPDIVFVGLGSPKQEQLIIDLLDLLPGSWWLGVGISFSFLAGEVQRAPRWMQDTGLEWTHRLVQEPRRLARRYLVDGLPFATRLLTASAVERLHRRQTGE